MLLSMLGESDVSQQAWANRVEADVLVISGSRDQMVNPASALQAAELLDAERLVHDSNCGHLGTVCEADSVRASVHEFLK